MDIPDYTLSLSICKEKLNLPSEKCSSKCTILVYLSPQISFHWVAFWPISMDKSITHSFKSLKTCFIDIASHWTK